MAPLKISSDSSDEELALALAWGSEEAYNVLVERYSSLIYHIALKITGSREDSHDIAQEVFLKIHSNIKDFSPSKASFKTWILTITRNLSINVFASIKRRSARFVYAFLGDPEDNPIDFDRFPSSGPDPEKALLNRQDLDSLNKALDKLPEKQRTALILKAWEGLSYREIGEIMGLSLSSVESLIFRARVKLTDQLL